MSKYEELRNNVFLTTSEDIGITLTNEKQVYAGVVDILVNNTKNTLVCLFDGTVSMYYSNEHINIGLGDLPKVRRAAMNFLFNASQCIEFMEITDNTDIADIADMRVYLKTRGCVYTIALFPDVKMDKVRGFLNLLIQNILSEIRLSVK
jgi:hypothetical protein